MHFRRQQEKKMCVLGLVSILAVPDAAMPADIAAGLPQLLSGIMALLVDLKRQLEAAEKAAEEQHDEDEVGGYILWLLADCYHDKDMAYAAAFCTLCLMSALAAGAS